jgi:hypothetical protein
MAFAIALLNECLVAGKDEAHVPDNDPVQRELLRHISVMDLKPSVFPRDIPRPLAVQS